MTTPIYKSLVDEQVDDLDGILKRPRETLVCQLECPVKGDWRPTCRDNAAFMEGDWAVDPRGRLVEQ
ncbi:hypothetical protein M1D68_16095 [Pseudomonas sp. R4-84]